ncbi:hypothetical protein ACLMJK_004580 [Lecanora helva]
MGKLTDFLLGSSQSPGAGDGYGIHVATKESSRRPPDIRVDLHSDVRSDFSLSSRSDLGLSSASSSVSQDTRPETKREQDMTVSKGSAELSQTRSDGSAVSEPLRDLDLVDWQNYEIPEELALIVESTPPTLQSIIQESMDGQRAIRLSVMESSTVLESPDARSSSPVEGAAIVESSSMASAGSPLNGEHPRLSFDRPDDSASNFESRTGSDVHLKPPPNPQNRSASSSALLDSKPKGTPLAHSTELSQQPCSDKATAKKYHRLLKMLRHEKARHHASRSPSRKASILVECTSCFDDLPDTTAVALPCSHFYCKSCFTQLVSTSIEHEINFPPKCCLTQIPKKTIRDSLSAEVCAKFDIKLLEYAVPAGNRYYCVSTACGRWIDTRHARRKNGTLECPHCHERLCTICRGPEHPLEEDCPEDFELDRTLEQAVRAGWRILLANVGPSFGMHPFAKDEIILMASSYTCGKKWRTCRCTEEDQRRRNQQISEQLEQFEAHRRAEEVRLQAARAAVEAAERRLREERDAEEARMAEEAREVEMMETERIHHIAEHFEYLRDFLQRIGVHQETAIEDRHAREWAKINDMRIALGSPESVANREAYVRSERDRVVESTETTIRALRRQHATCVKEMLTRHRKSQDDLLASFADAQDTDIESPEAERLQGLMYNQGLERSKINLEQVTEIKKWKDRGEASIKAFDAGELSLTLRIEEEEKIRSMERKMGRTVDADRKWTQVLLEDRYAMLAEDERRMVQNGSEAPERVFESNDAEWY